jgi:hypothetical protein
MLVRAYLPCHPLGAYVEGRARDCSWFGKLEEQKDVAARDYQCSLHGR